MAGFLFWSLLLLVLYTYVGYGALISVLLKLPFMKKKFFLPYNARPVLPDNSFDELPVVSLVIPACGESAETIRRKLLNIARLDYPRDKFEVFFAFAHTNEAYGNDGLLKYYDMVLCPGSIGLEDADLSKIFITKDIIRSGKLAQTRRTLSRAKGSILVFSDANTSFNTDALKNLVAPFANAAVGVVAGEKRVLSSNTSTSGEGEGLYWRYESLLKRWDAELYSAMGAAGEIFAVRKFLWDNISIENALIEDFVISMKIAALGYRIAYAPDAKAEELPTERLEDEFIRRRRISAGGLQAIALLVQLLNIFRYRVLSFQYISHRLLRWAVTPFVFPILFVSNFLIFQSSGRYFYEILFIAQVIFYLCAITGWWFELRRKKFAPFYFPYVFCMMNLAVYAGLGELLLGKQSVLWQRVRRQE
jgi:cellulose synthase/poly-beta-1,6-N-acetylglucosamine synthase-like glycosyltransferase